MHTSKHTLIAALVAALAVAPAFAGNGKGHGKHGGGHGKHAVVQKHGGKHAAVQHGGKHSGKAAKRVDRVDRDRTYRHGYAYSNARVMGAGPACPPGLAKKDNGCMPPGQAKKLIGERVPAGAIYTIPPNVLSTLPPPPVGYRYAIIGNQVVMVSSGDIIVDIIRSLLG